MFTCCSMASFISCFPVLRANQPSVLSVRVLPSCVVLYYMVDAQLHLQPQLIHYKEHTVLCYMLSTQLFIKPQHVPHVDPGCDPVTHSWPGCCVCGRGTGKGCWLWQVRTLKCYRPNCGSGVLPKKLSRVI